jgi:hypothetical protein
MMQRGMKWKRGFVLLGISVAACMCSVTPSRAMRVPRIELMSVVRVSGARLLLSDLLPASAVGDLRAQAAEISLGASPQPGTTRVLERAHVLENIGGSEDVAGRITVPERIVVSREFRLITVQEVLAAIQAAAGSGGVPAGAHLRPEDVQLQAQILVAPGDAGLLVLRSEFDAGLKLARFLLWPSKDPRVLPFFATAQLAGIPPADFVRRAEPSRGTTSGAVSSPAPLTPAHAEFLVSAGQDATLLVESGALRFTADVIPLERGTMGQRVRVRVVDTGKMFSAQVDGRAHLQLNF